MATRTVQVPKSRTYGKKKVEKYPKQRTPKIQKSNEMTKFCTPGLLMKVLEDYSDAEYELV